MWWLLMVSKRWRDEQRTSIFKTENPPDPKTIVAIAVASILSSKEQLARTIEELSKHLPRFVPLGYVGAPWVIGPNA
jgi:hypothetical protein